MAQVEQPANLDRWHNPDGRVLTLILMRCGLRVGDACNLAFDCIIRDADGAAYVRYLNRKMKREALVPIDEEVENEITTQHQRVLDRWSSYPSPSTHWPAPSPRTAKATQPSAPWPHLHGSSPAASPDARSAPHS